MDDRSFAAAMVRRRKQARTRREFPEVPEGVLACATCSGAGVAGGSPCRVCRGWGFVDENDKPVPLHTVQGGFYVFAEGDLVLQNIVTVASAAARRWDCRAVVSEELNDWIIARERLSQRYSAREFTRGVELWPLPTPAPKEMIIRLINNPTVEEMAIIRKDKDGSDEVSRTAYPAIGHMAVMTSRAARPERLMAAVNLFTAADIKPYQIEIRTPSVYPGAPLDSTTGRFARTDELVAVLSKAAEFPTAPILLRCQTKSGLMLDLFTM